MDIKELIHRLIVENLINYVILISFTTTIIYLTYRFWEFLLPKSENKVFIENAPVVWSLKLDELIELIKKNNK